MCGLNVPRDLVFLVMAKVYPMVWRREEVLGKQGDPTEIKRS